MIRPVKKTLARKVPCLGKEIIIYLQPNGMLVLRKPHGRKRYGVGIEFIFAKAKEGGPIEDLFSGLIQGCAGFEPPKSRKKAA